MVAGSGDAFGEANRLYRFGNRCGLEGRYEQALVAYGEALALAPGHPDILLNTGNAQLCLGHDREGWANYQHRPERRNSAANRLGFPEWRGEPLPGKRLFIWPEQGLGDQIFAARFLAGLEADVTLVLRTCPGSAV